MLAVFVVSIFLGFPIAFTLLALGFGFGYALKGDIIFNQVIIKAYEVTTNDVLVAVPLFLFMGYVIERANILDRLFRSIQSAARMVPGSLAVATLITCALFATATGIVGAVVTLMGLLAFPAMLRAGYDQKLASGVVCAGGCLGILIPPSILLILYAAIAGTSAVRLYAGALIPGFLLAGLYVAYVISRALLNPRLAPKANDDTLEPLGVNRSIDFYLPVGAGLALFAGAAIARWLGTLPDGYLVYVGVAAPLLSLVLLWPRLGRLQDGLYPLLLGLGVVALCAGMFWLARLNFAYLPYVGMSVAVLALLFALLGWRVTVALLESFFPLAFLIMVVLGAIMFGWATPSEAAAVGALGAIVLAAAYRALSFERIREAVYLTARATAMVCWLFVGSATFASVLGDYGGDQLVAGFFKGLDLTPWQFMLISQLIIFALGWPLEWTEILIIFVPIFLPLLKVYQIDPMLFGIMVALNIQTAFLSPPVAMACYYLKGVAPKHVTLNTIFSGSMPYLAIIFLAMLLLYLVPGFATWLPSYLYDAK
jgi:TRAP-type mannitol/chloroaromatic compound transport system permease large subunit